MNLKLQQGEESRQRIINAALSVFSNAGYSGSSTRDIATRAGANQGLITYHFQSKEKLWRAAADYIFGLVATTMAGQLASIIELPPRDKSREMIRLYVRFAAEHPELFRMMVDEGTQTDGRMAWLVATHIKPLYATFCNLTSDLGDQWSEDNFPYLFYTMVGASSLIFAVAPECRQLTGIDPLRKASVEAHADIIANLLIPNVSI